MFFRALIPLLFLAPLSVISQIDLNEPDMDDNILNSKQYLRAKDYNNSRASDVNNPDMLKFERWQELNSYDNKASMQPWENFGPDTVSGRIISIAFHPTDPNTFLVGSASGGLWRTNDYGLNWEPLTDNFMTMGIGAVAYNPQNPNTILIASGEGYGFGNEYSRFWCFYYL